jgi:hypothetical protein
MFFNTAIKPSLTDSKLFFVFYIPICPSLKSHKEAIHVVINNKFIIKLFQHEPVSTGSGV